MKESNLLLIINILDYFRAPKSRFFTTLFPEPVMLSAGNSFTLPITFRPLEKIAYDGCIEFVTNVSVLFLSFYCNNYDLTYKLVQYIVILFDFLKYWLLNVYFEVLKYFDWFCCLSVSDWIADILID